MLFHVKVYGYGFEPRIETLSRQPLWAKIFSGCSVVKVRRKRGKGYVHCDEDIIAHMFWYSKEEIIGTDQFRFASPDRQRFR